MSFRYHANKETTTEKKYKIYKLVHEGDIVYIGRTTMSLIKRKRCGYKGCGKGMLQPILKDCTIELIENTDDVKRERYWIHFYKQKGEPLLNVSKGEGYDVDISHKEWVETNQDYYKEYNIRYYEKNKELLKKYQREDPTDNNSKYRKEYYSYNKEIMDQKSTQYKKDNKEAWNEFQKLYKKRKYWQDKVYNNPKDTESQKILNDLNDQYENRVWRK